MGDAQRFQRRKQPAVETPMGCGEPRRLDPRPAQNGDAATDVPQVLLHRAVGVMPVAVRPHLQPAEPT